MSDFKLPQISGKIAEVFGGVTKRLNDIKGEQPQARSSQVSQPTTDSFGRMKALSLPLDQRLSDPSTLGLLMSKLGDSSNNSPSANRRGNQGNFGTVA